MKRFLFSFGLLACWFGVLAQCPGLSPTTLPFTEDFESYTGAVTPLVASDSTFNCAPTYRWDFRSEQGFSQLSFTSTSYTGSQSAVMDVSSSINLDTGYTTLTLNLSTYSASTNDVVLSFYYRENGDETHPEDKVWVRGSSSDSWIEILDWNAAGNGSTWTLGRFIISNILAANSQSLSATTQIRWGQTDDYPWGSDGFAFDDVSVEEVTCAQPSAITVSNIGSSSLDLSWTTGGATAWQISYDTTGMAAGSNITNVTGALPYNVTGLVQGVTYDFYVRDSCGNADVSFWEGPYSVTMNCTGYAAPYNNDFEGETTNEEPICWAQYHSYSSAYAEVRTTGSPRSGSKQLVMYSSNSNSSDTLIAVSPQYTDITAGDKQLRFHAKTSDNANDLFIGTIASPSPTATFNALDTISFSTNNTYQEVFVDLTTANGYNGTDEYVVLAHSLGGTYDYIYVDDFNYELIPACRKPISLNLDNVTDNSATISFDSRGGTNYEYIYGPVNFDQATATVYTSSTNPVVVTNLFSNFTYELYLRNDCGTNGNSAWTGPFTFTTDCVPYGPFFTDFESDPLDGMPDCWTEYATYSSAYVEVEDYGTQYSGDQNLLLYNSFFSSTSPQTTMAITPRLAGIANGDKQVSFYAQTSDVQSDLIVGTLPTADGTATFTAIDTIDFTTANAYQQYTVLLDAAHGYNGTDEYIGLMHGNGTTYDYIYIDDFAYAAQPQCFPTLANSVNILYVTKDSVFFNWTPGDGLKQIVEIGPAGFTPGSGLYQFSTADTFAGQGMLSAVTNYDIYIQDSCANSLSPASGPISFTTDCDVTVAPFKEDFDNWTVNPDSISYCWSTSSASSYVWQLETGSTGSSNTGPSGDFSGTGNYAYTEASSGLEGDTARLITARVDVSGLTQMEVAFYYHMYGGDMGSLFIEINDGTNTYSGLGKIDGQQQNADTDPYKQFVFNPAALSLASDTVTITIGGIRGDGYEGDIAIDEFEVREATTCATVAYETIGAITANTADVSWLSGTGNSNVNWGPAGFSQGSGAGSFSRGVTSPYTITGLTPNTSYDIYIQDSCASGGNGAWVGPITFTTPCLSALAAGTYTIGKGATADFATFDSVATVLNDCGISGAVVFNIQPGLYTDKLHLMSVPGVSTVNTITFNGSGNDTLRWNQQGPQAAVLIDSVNHVTLNNMRIENMAGAESWGVLITNHSDSVVIDSCTVEVDKSLTSTDISTILVSNSYDNDIAEGAEVDYLTVTNSTLIGGYYSVALEGNGTNDFAVGHVISGNTIIDFYNAGIYTDDLADFTVTDNVIETSRSSADGIYLTDVNDFTIEGNTVNVTDYGIYVTDGNDGAAVTAASTLINNMVRSTTDYAIYLNDAENVNVYHNTAYGEPGLAINDQDTVNIRNNVFASDGDYAFESFDSIMPIEVMDYNLFYRGGTGDPIRVDGNNYADLPAFQAAYSALNANSVEGDPLFTSSMDLHVRGTLANDVGDNSVGITTDIDGDIRPGGTATTVDMGADEYEPINVDIAVIDIVEPTSYQCGDSNTTVSVVVQNVGLNNVSNFNLTVDVSGAGTATLNGNYPGTLTNLQTDTITISSFNSVQGGLFTITAYTALSGDQFNANDTLERDIQIQDALPVDIFASDSAICVAQAVTFWADTNMQGLPYAWTDLKGNPLGTGDTLSLPNVDSTTTVVLSVDTAALLPPFNAGPADTTIGTASGFSSLAGQSLIVDAKRDVTINQMKIYPQNSGNLILELRDTANSTVIQSITVPVIQSGAAYMPVVISPNLSMPTGVYELGASSSSTVGGLLRNSNGATFPYGDPAVFEIVTQTFGLSNPSNASYQDYYYYFFDMVVASGAGCERPSSQFTVQFGQGAVSAAFTSSIVSVNSADVDVDFDASASTTDANATYTWNFGDGNTGTGIMPQHTYTANGTYNVKLVVDGACGKDSITQQVVIQGISIEENMLSRSLEVYPNPTTEKINLVFDAGSAQSAVVYVSDMTGKVLFAKEYNNMNGEFTGELSLENLPKGTYILNVKSDGMSAQRRIIKI